MFFNNQTQYFYVFALSHIRRPATSSSYFIEKIRSSYSWQRHKNIVLFVAISIAFNGYIMIEYQTEPDAVKEFHRTSVKFLTGLIVAAFWLYLFH